MPRSLYQRIAHPEEDGLSKLLGPLEVDVMAVMWVRGSATVRDVTTALQVQRPVAYTTVMTIMINLAGKGLLHRIPLDKRTHLYQVAVTQEVFIQSANERVVHALIRDFGELALAEFALALEEATPDQRTRYKRLLKERAARGRSVEEEPDGG